ncbi:MAG: type IV pilus twitching motility protein PilT [Myxococcaceae bacterium]
MELATFNQFLTAAVKNGASDVHFKVGSSPALRINGQLLPVKVPALQPEDTERIAAHILGKSHYKGVVADLQEHDTSYVLDGVGRFRASVFRNKGNLAAVMRSIPFVIPDFEKLGLPKAPLEKIAQEERGLILVTGVTGSGKSSTLAAMVHYINQHYRKHILTIEDPIEFLHEDKASRITQREIGPDTPTFSAALRAALRQDPDVILVGEMRDAETIEIAIKAAETGHLVLSTVHTTDCVRTIGRLIGVFPPEGQHGVRTRLADNLRATISQRLLPHASGKGRVVAAEIMISTLSVVEFIKDDRRTHEIKDSGSGTGFPMAWASRSTSAACSSRSTSA